MLGHLGLFALRTVQTVRALLLFDLLVDERVQHALVVSIDRVAVRVTERALLLAVQRATRVAQRVALQLGVLGTAEAILGVCTVAGGTGLLEQHSIASDHVLLAKAVLGLRRCGQQAAGTVR